MTLRDEELCQKYVAGHSVQQCAEAYSISRERVRQILRKAGVWKTGIWAFRREFIGVNVTEEVKDALQAKADAEGTSVSKLAALALEDLVEEKK